MTADEFRNRIERAMPDRVMRLGSDDFAERHWLMLTGAHVTLGVRTFPLPDLEVTGARHAMALIGEHAAKHACLLSTMQRRDDPRRAAVVLELHDGQEVVKLRGFYEWPAGKADGPPNKRLKELEELTRYESWGAAGINAAISWAIARPANQVR